MSVIPVDESIFDCLTSIMTSRERLMRQFISRMQVDVCHRYVADTIIKYPLKNFEDSTMKVKLSKSGLQNEAKIQRDIISTLISLFTQHKAPLDIEAVMA